MDFGLLDFERKGNESDVGCYSPVTPDQHLDWGADSKLPSRHLFFSIA